MHKLAAPEFKPNEKLHQNLSNTMLFRRFNRLQDRRIQIQS